MAKLVVIHGEANRREILIGDEAMLGRAPGCDLIILGPHISRQHARVTRGGDAYYIEDLGSANGTCLNGSAVTKAELRDGDWVSIGECRLTFVMDDAYAPPQEALWLDEALATVVEAVEVEKPTLRQGTDDSLAVKSLRGRLDAVRAVSEKLCGAGDVREVVQAALEELLRVYSQAEHAHAVVSGCGDGADDLRLSVTRPELTPARLGMSRTLLAIATSERKAVLASDVTSDVELGAAESIVRQNLRSIMCSPLWMAGRVLGAVQVDTSSAVHPFNGDDLALLVVMAGLMAAAAENARLHREIVARERLAAVGQAVAGVAHCTKNLLNSLQGGAYILELGLRDGDSQRVAKGWEMVKRNAGFMSDLVKDMLAYCRRAPPVRECTDVAVLLQDTLLMVQEAASQKGVATSLVVEGNLPPVEVDVTGIRRAVLNLLVNAVEVCSTGCHVRLVAQPCEGDAAVRISVEDDGPGMSAEVKARLFEPFFTTKGSRGTGLGLPLVRKIAEEHGGHVEVRSEPGAGTAFHLLIPLGGHEGETELM